MAKAAEAALFIWGLYFYQFFSLLDCLPIASRFSRLCVCLNSNKSLSLVVILMKLARNAYYSYTLYLGLRKVICKPFITKKYQK